MILKKNLLKIWVLVFLMGSCLTTAFAVEAPGLDDEDKMRGRAESTVTVEGRSDFNQNTYFKKKINVKGTSKLQGKVTVGTARNRVDDALLVQGTSQLEGDTTIEGADFIVKDATGESVFEIVDDAVTLGKSRAAAKTVQMSTDRVTFGKEGAKVTAFFSGLSTFTDLATLFKIKVPAAALSPASDATSSFVCSAKITYMADGYNSVGDTYKGSLCYDVHLQIVVRGATFKYRFYDPEYYGYYQSTPTQNKPGIVWRSCTFDSTAGEVSIRVLNPARVPDSECYALNRPVLNSEGIGDTLDNQEVCVEVTANYPHKATGDNAFQVVASE